MNWEKGFYGSYTYEYDEANRRISKMIGTETIQYQYDGDSIDVLYETDGNGKMLRQYVYSDDNIRLAMKMNGKTLYYHYNAHGDVIALTDESGKIVANYEYDAWGNVLKSEATTTEAKANPYGYAGYMYDKEIQQYYLMARYYEPAQGVFTAIDPDPGAEDDPQTMNGYNYANNNPVMFVDPDGEYAVVVYFIPGIGQVLAVGTVIGGGVYVGYKYRHKIRRGAKKLWGRTKSFFSNPIGRKNRKKQGREVNEKKKKNKNFKSRSNKNPNRKMKKHTPSKKHKGGK